MGQITDALNKMFSQTAGWGSYLLAVAGLGTLTMAILQAIKDLTPVRQWFQRYRMLAFLKVHADLAGKEFGVKTCQCEAEREIILLATDGDRDAFYSLE